MGCSGREWCDWCSYHPRLPEKIKLSRPFRIKRDDLLIAQLEKEAVTFLDEVEDYIDDLCRIYGIEPVIKSGIVRPTLAQKLKASAEQLTTGGVSAQQHQNDGVP